MAGNPLSYFEAGKQGGQVRSGAFGIGNAIRGVLQQGQKMGLINAQVGGNLATGLATSGFKQQLEDTANAQPQTYKIVNPNTGEVTDVDSTVGNKPIVGGGQPNIYNLLGGEDPGTPQTPELSLMEQYKVYQDQLKAAQQGI